jgi:hypothetical protein
VAAPSRREDVLRPDQLGRAAKNPRGRGRLPPLIAARGRGAQAAARAHPVLRRARELDRIPSDSGRLRTRGAHPRPHDVESVFADRALDRRADLVLGCAAAPREPARPLARGRGIHLRRANPARDLRLRRVGPGLSLGDRGLDGARLSELKARPVYFVAEHTLKTAENADAIGGPPARSAAE